MKNKLNPDIFIQAAERYDAGTNHSQYACCVIDSVAGEYFKYSAERIFFIKIFNIDNKTYNQSFNIQWAKLENWWPTPDELREIRILALLLAAEIARLKNNHK